MDIFNLCPSIQQKSGISWWITWDAMKPMLDQKMADTAMELYQSIKLKSRFDGWNDMSTELDKIYQQFVRWEKPQSCKPLYDWS